MRIGFRRQLLLIVGVAAGVAAVLAYEGDALRRMEVATIDARFRSRSEPASKTITVVIDEKTLDAALVNGERVRWPFPRSLHARVIDALRHDGARVMAYDVLFTEPTVEREDNALIRAAARARPVVFAAAKVEVRGKTNVFGGEDADTGLDVLRDVAHGRAGNVNYHPLDPGAVYRRVPFAVDGLKSLPVVVAEVAKRRSLRPEDIGGQSALIDYAGPPDTIPSVSFVDVLRGRFRPGTFTGKIVVVGASDPTLLDVHATSTSGDGLMPGPEIHANAIETVLRGGPLRTIGSPLSELLIFFTALVVPLATARMRPLGGPVLAAGTAVAYLVFADVAFMLGRVLPVVYPLAGLALATIGSLAVHYLLSALDRQRAHDTFARFVPELVVDRLLAQTNEDMRLAGVRGQATVMFTDIRGFTTFSERRDPEEIIDVLNRYFEEMTEAILDHGGTLVNYMGDGIMALFGAPLEQPDHADRALASALEMLNVRLPRVNVWLRKNGVADGFRIGIGLHSGPIVSGNIGSMRHLQYAAIGDTCNSASRIEGLTKQAGYQLLMSQATRDLLSAQPDELRFFDAVEIRGRAEKIHLYGFAPY